MAKYLEWEAAKIENEQAYTGSPVIMDQARRLSSAAGTLRLHVHARSLPVTYNLGFNSTCVHGNYATACLKCSGNEI
jgi:hypothetical protein